MVLVVLLRWVEQTTNVVDVVKRLRDETSYVITHNTIAISCLKYSFLLVGSGVYIRRPSNLGADEYEVGIIQTKIERYVVAFSL